MPDSGILDGGLGKQCAWASFEGFQGPGDQQADAQRKATDRQ
jgi:hypothetical protein